jgi:hypothetical protein
VGFGILKIPDHYFYIFVMISQPPSAVRRNTNKSMFILFEVDAERLHETIKLFE